ncbi:hypothetical protein HPB48_007662 [Haemaphysalis longicornis]|uniref:Uncharacterized protein n=1 Tax=Haemaphysalis longicornis TaxID=44386 RepID=A0A9J6G433_HAELO|nr:hypothetical protein HPB48_007662 [Haemaphysalis longicornis]
MAGKEADYYKKGETKGGFLRFLYNPDTKEVFGRTGLSWFKITVFYIIFYACLTAFWTIMLIVFYQTLDTIKPTWVLDGSCIGTVPGLGFRPRPPEKNVDSTLIYFKAGNGGTWKYWVDDIQSFLKDYDRQEADGEHVRTCSFDQPIDPKENKACRFALEHVKSNCSKAQDLRLRVRTALHPPQAQQDNKSMLQIEWLAIFVSIPSSMIHACRVAREHEENLSSLAKGQIFDWVPEPYDNDSFPQKIPTDVKETYDPRYVYITCEGENVADVENMGKLAYFPSNRIENYYFPYRNTPGYLSPFVFVQFLRPERGVLINMECKAWAKNIKHDRQDRVGSAHFELMID